MAPVPQWPDTAQARSEPERLLQVLLQPETERVEPRCRHFGVCGGCQLQHLPQAAQLRGKQAMIVRLLNQFGIADVPPIQVHAAEPWHYRNRVRLRVQGSELGYNRRGSNEFLAIQECPILSPMLWRAAAALRNLVREDEAAWPAGTASAELFATGDETALQLAVHVDATVSTLDRDAPATLRQLCDSVHRAVPELAGAGLSVNAPTDPRSSRRRVQEALRVEVARWGSPGLSYVLAETTYQVTRHAFFQVNRFLTGEMVQLVTGERRGALAWDLYAGAGLFAVPLAQRFQRVVAVEIGEPAVTDLAANLPNKEHTVVKSTTADFLKRQPANVAPDLVVLDPPRAGLGVGVVESLARVAAQEIVYVSCDAATFARDARGLLHSGYTLHQLHLLDLFPQTFHTETVAVFRR